MDLLRLNQILATLALLSGAALLTYLIIRRSQIPRMDLIVTIEVVVFLIVEGVLNYLSLYGVETRITSTLDRWARWLFFLAVLTTSIIFMINKSINKSRG